MQIPKLCCGYRDVKGANASGYMFGVRGGRTGGQPTTAAPAICPSLSCTLPPIVHCLPIRSLAPKGQV